MPFTGVVPQAFPHRSTGATLVQFGSIATDGTTSADDATMLNLGYCEDRVQIEERPLVFHHQKVKPKGDAAKK